MVIMLGLLTESYRRETNLWMKTTMNWDTPRLVAS